MTTYAIEEQKLTNIADAIRGKTGGVDTLSVDEMATEIGNINTGVGEVSWNDLKDKPFYETVVRDFTVECAADSGTLLEGFPAFEVGDTVAVTVDGVEHSLVAFDYEGLAVIGESPDGIGDNVGHEWMICQEGTDTIFGSPSAHTVSYQEKVVVQIPSKFLPESLQFGERIGTDTIWEGVFETAPTDNEYDTNPNPQAKITTIPEDGYSAFTTGETYMVKFDGVEYMCEYRSGNAGGNFFGFGDVFLCYVDERERGIINGKAFEDTGEPFLLIYWYGWYLYTKETGRHTISVNNVSISVEPINPKFIPWLKITYDGTNYAANMTYEEAAALIGSKSLLGGCYIDADGVVFPFVTIEHDADVEEVSGKFNNWGDDMFITLNHNGVTAPYGLS